MIRGVVLAAGHGTRLRPLTLQRPKPLVPLLGHSLLWRALDNMQRRLGELRLAVNASYRAEDVTTAVVSWGDRFGDVVVSVEPGEPLGTAGGLALALERMGGAEAPVLVHNADCAALFDWRAALDALHESADVALFVVEPPPERPELRKVLCEVDGRVGELDGVARPGCETSSPEHRRLAYAGALAARPGALATLPSPGRRGCIKRDWLWPLLRAGARVAWVRHHGVWRDVATPRQYVEAHADALGDPVGWIDTAERVRPGVWRAPSARVAASARLLAPAYVGPGARVGDGATVGPAASIEEGGVVAGGARVRRAVVWPGAVARGDVERAVVTARGTVDAS